MHRTDVRIKLIGMIGLSLLLLSVSPFRLLVLLPLLLSLHAGVRRSSGKTDLSLFLLIMPLIIFAGNFTSLSLTAHESAIKALTISLLRTLRFIYILWMALLFTATTDPLTITPAFYTFLKYIPLVPARRISTQMGLSLTLIPLILDEMQEIRDAMASRCGWSPRWPIRNLIHLGMPLLEGVLVKAESLSDAMESRLYSEEATEPEIFSRSVALLPLLILIGLISGILILEQWEVFQNSLSNLIKFY